MLNKELLVNKFKPLLGEDAADYAKTIEEANQLKLYFKLEQLKNEPLFVYSRNKRNALYFLLGMHFSLVKDRVLDYAVISGKSLSNQHFATEATRDLKLYDAVYYSDITFISLSQFDYTSEYMETLLIELLEFRKNLRKLTVISYDVMDSGTNYLNTTKKLHSYFMMNEFQILDLVSSQTKSALKADITHADKPTIEAKRKVRIK